jgi:APA family basic amino acid/polyamine antiporter
VSGHWEKVRSGEAGRRVVQEALEINARAVIMPLRRATGGALFPSTVQRLLEERPCRVILTSEPAESVKRVAAST